MKRAIWILPWLVVLVTAGDLFGQVSFGQDTLSIPSPSTYAPSMFGLIVKLVLSLGLIVGLIYLSTYFLKKVNSRGGSDIASGGSIKVISRTYIAHKQCLYVVKIGERFSVLGATESNINLIGEIRKEEVEKFDQQPIKPLESTSFAKFSDILKGKLRP